MEKNIKFQFKSYFRISNQKEEGVKKEGVKVGEGEEGECVHGGRGREGRERSSSIHSVYSKFISKFIISDELREAKCKIQCT